MLFLCVTRFLYLFKNYPNFYPHYYFDFFDPYQHAMKLFDNETYKFVCVIHLLAKYACNRKKGFDFGLT